MTLLEGNFQIIDWYNYEKIWAGKMAQLECQVESPSNVAYDIALKNN